MFSPLNKKWSIISKRADFKRTAEHFHVNIVIARMLRNRDVIEDEDIRKYLYGSCADLYSPWDLKDMDRAVDILSRKIEEKKSIRIIGDYDVDGVTSTYILYHGLSRLGVTCSIRIPHRIYDGYGMNVSMIEEAARDGVDTILTCDNGIGAAREITLAKEMGMTVIVTDHHEVPYRTEDGQRIPLLPPADALIDPKQEGCPYPNKNLCGATVALKLIQALYERAGMAPSAIEEYYEFAAIATVSDVMVLQDENRIFVKEGLRRLPVTDNVGLQELILATGLDGKQMTAYHIGFILGPCINATGRLETAREALDLLLCDDHHKAAEIARHLVSVNEQRKAMTEDALTQAIGQVEQMPPLDPAGAQQTGGIDPVLVVYLPDCHESLAGIVAGRLRERYDRPAFVLTDGQTNVKGSGRSIDAYSMFDELVACDSLLDNYGGHPKAAGLSLQKEQLETFRKMINDNCTLTADDLSPKLRLDAELPISLVDRSLIEQFHLLEPFGTGNSKPVFVCRDVRIRNLSVVGKNRNVLRMQLTDPYQGTIDAVCFDNVDKMMEDLTGRSDLYAIAYYPEINSYKGRESLQIIIKDYILDKPQ